MTMRDAIAAATQLLAANPDLQPSSGTDAEFLLRHQLSLSRADLRAHPERMLAEKDELLYQQSIVRRLSNEPIQYITGQQEFYGRRFHVTPAVLIPRPETEHLVEAVLGLLPRDRHLRIVDVGTGSGMIAITLAIHLPQATLTAVDLSPDALTIASENALTHGVAPQIRFLESDLLESVSGQHFDCIVSNPPYVPVSDRSTLHPQVRDHEPAMALFAGPDGLDLYRRLVPDAWAALVPSGLLAMEIGYDQQPDIAALLHSWQEVSFEKDLQGIPRVALARRDN